MCLDELNECFEHEETPEVENEVQDEQEHSLQEEPFSGDIGDQELVACQRESALWKERYLRVNADLENMQRRLAKDREASLLAAQSDIFGSLLAVIDNFDRALADQRVLAEPAFKSWVDGIVMVRKELAGILASYGVEEITQVQTFDPELHEALAQVDVPDKESGAIVDVLQKGYRFKGRVLRHTKVAVAR